MVIPERVVEDEELLAGHGGVFSGGDGEVRARPRSCAGQLAGGMAVPKMASAEKHGILSANGKEGVVNAVHIMEMRLQSVAKSKSPKHYV